MKKLILALLLVAGVAGAQTRLITPVRILPKASGAGPGELDIDNSAGTFYVGFKAGSITANLVWTLPTADAAGCLESNGSLVLSFGSCGLPLTGGTMTGSILASGTPNIGSTGNWFNYSYIDYMVGSEVILDYAGTNVANLAASTSSDIVLTTSVWGVLMDWNIGGSVTIGNSTHEVDFMPAVTDTMKIGSPSLEFKSVYSQNLVVSSLIIPDATNTVSIGQSASDEMLKVWTQDINVGSLAGSGTQCVQVTTAGLLQGTGSPCPSGSSYLQLTGGTMTGSILVSGTVNLGSSGSPFGSEYVGTLDLTGITGSTQCLQVNSSGVVSGAGAACPNGSLYLPLAGGTMTGSILASGTPNIGSTGNWFNYSYIDYMVGSEVILDYAGTNVANLAASTSSDIVLTTSVWGVLMDWNITGTVTLGNSVHAVSLIPGAANSGSIGTSSLPFNNGYYAGNLEMNCYTGGGGFGSGTCEMLAENNTASGAALIVLNANASGEGISDGSLGGDYFNNIHISTSTYPSTFLWSGQAPSWSALAGLVLTSPGISSGQTGYWNSPLMATTGSIPTAISSLSGGTLCCGGATHVAVTDFELVSTLYSGIRIGGTGPFQPVNAAATFAAISNTNDSTVPFGVSIFAATADTGVGSGWVQGLQTTCAGWVAGAAILCDSTLMFDNYWDGTNYVGYGASKVIGQGYYSWLWDSATQYLKVIDIEGFSTIQPANDSTAIYINEFGDVSSTTVGYNHGIWFDQGAVLASGSAILIDAAGPCTFTSTNAPGNCVTKPSAIITLQARDGSGNALDPLTLQVASSGMANISATASLTLHAASEAFLFDTSGNFTMPGGAGSGTRCAQFTSAGLLQAASSACGGSGSWSAATGGIYYGGGNVGIGSSASNPVGKLEVDGDVWVNYSISGDVVHLGSTDWQPQTANSVSLGDSGHDWSSLYAHYVWSNTYVLATTFVEGPYFFFGSTVYTYATLPSASAGTMLYCSDCQSVVGNCTNSGNGSLAIKDGAGNWKCM